MSADRPATIIAVTSERERHRKVVERAATVASETGATVILFDIESAGTSPLESPLPTDSSADGESEQFGKRLDPGDLEAAGQGSLADQVRVVRAAGVNAFGWLPDKSDAKALAEYAADQAADLVLVSAEDTDLIEGLRTGDTGDVETADPSEPGPNRVHVEAVPVG
jgi:hypothetical protein